jgi:hypothetical protein
MWVCNLIGGYWRFGEHTADILTNVFREDGSSKFLQHFGNQLSDQMAALLNDNMKFHGRNNIKFHMKQTCYER